MAGCIIYLLKLLFTINPKNRITHLVFATGEDKEERELRFSVQDRRVQS